MPIGGANTVDGFGELLKFIKESAYEVCERVACKILYKATEIKEAVVLKIEIEIVSNPADIGAKLEIVTSADYGHAVLPMERDIVKFGRTLRVGPEVEARGGHDRRRCARGIIRVHVGKAEGRRRSVVMRHKLKNRTAISAEDELIHHGRAESVKPGDGTQLRAGESGETGAHRHVSPGRAAVCDLEGNVPGQIINDVISADRILVAQVVIHAHDALIVAVDFDG